MVADIFNIKKRVGYYYVEKYIHHSDFQHSIHIDIPVCKDVLLVFENGENGNVIRAIVPSSYYYCFYKELEHIQVAGPRRGSSTYIS